MIRKIYFSLLVSVLIPFSASAGLFELGTSKTTIDDFNVVDMAQATGRQGQYTIKDLAFGEVQVKFFGRWRKALNAQLLVETPREYNCQVEELVEVIKQDPAIGLRLKAAITAPSSYLAKGLESAKEKFPELDTEKKELDQMIKVIRSHGSRDIYEGNIFVERSSQTMWFEYSSKIDDDIQTTLVELESTESFFDSLMNIWLVDGQSSKSKIRISLKNCFNK